MHVVERSIPVSAALRPWISGISIATIPAGHGERTVVEPPDHSTTLALRVFPDEHTDLVVMGPRPRAVYHVGEPGPFCVSARIQPGRASSLLGRSTASLLDRAVPLSELWGPPGARLEDELARAGSDPVEIDEPLLLARIERAVMSRLSALSPRDQARGDLAHRAGRLLTGHDAAAGGPALVSATASQLHVSERHLRDLFIDAVGLSPKHFARVERLRNVLSYTGNTPWARAAIELGYYDQSHLNADFRAMMGVSTGTYLAGRLPAASRCRLRHSGGR